MAAARGSGSAGVVDAGTAGGVAVLVVGAGRCECTATGVPPTLWVDTLWEAGTADATAGVATGAGTAAVAATVAATAAGAAAEESGVAACDAASGTAVPGLVSRVAVVAGSTRAGAGEGAGAGAGTGTGVGAAVGAGAVARSGDGLSSALAMSPMRGPRDLGLVEVVGMPARGWYCGWYGAGWAG